MKKKKENSYQSRLIKRLKKEFPNCIVLKNDAGYIQGIPDLTLLCENKWAFLEVKRDSERSHRPNQDFYIQKAKELSYGSFIFPENEKEVFDEIKKTLQLEG